MSTAGRVPLVAWLVPAALTVASMMAAHGQSRSVPIACLVAAIAVLKARWIVVHFMGLRDRGTIWSRALVAWAVVVLSAAVLAQAWAVSR